MKIKTGALFLLTIVILSPFFSSGQKTKIPANKLKDMHEEAMDDPYLPNAFQNKKTSPSFQFNGKASFNKLMSTSVFTRQVNVDVSGQNILGDAGNEPSLAVNPLNPQEILIGWRQFDNVTSNFRQAGRSYSTDGGQTWTFPGVINPGLFRSDPVLDFDNSGNFYYNSLSHDSITNSYPCTIFKSSNGGVTLDTGTSIGGGDKQWMTIDRTSGPGNNNIYSTWTSGYSSCLPGFFTRSSNGGVSYENCIAVDGDPFWMNMATGNAGELYIGGGSNQTTDSLVVVKSTNAQIPASIIAWDPPVFVYMDGNISGWAINTAGITGQVNIDIDHSNGPGQGNVYLLASLERISNADPSDVMFVKSTNGGLTWSSPLRINDDISSTNNQWFGTMSVAPNGRIDVIWLDTRNVSTVLDESALYYSYSTDQGTTWSANEMLSPTFDPHIGYPNQNKMGDYFDMVSDNAGANLAWANTLNGEQDVFYSRIIPPVAIAVNENSNININIFPNPNDGTFVIKGLIKPSQIELYTLQGEIVYSKSIRKSSDEINISTLSSGIYFMKLVDADGNSIIRKIIRK